MSCFWTSSKISLVKNTIPVKSFKHLFLKNSKPNCRWLCLTWKCTNSHQPFYADWSKIVLIIRLCKFLYSILICNLFFAGPVPCSPQQLIWFTKPTKWWSLSRTNANEKEKAKHETTRTAAVSKVAVKKKNVLWNSLHLPTIYRSNEFLY